MSNENEKVKAAVIHKPGKMSIEYFEKPDLGPHDFLMKVELCGICSTDVERWHGNFLITPPQILGHEFFGTVADMGKDVESYRGIRKGDKVIAEILIPCGTCNACRRGEYNICHENNIELALNFGREPGWNIPTNRVPSIWGGFAQYLYIPEKAIIHKYNKNIDPKVAALTEPLATAVHAVNLSGLKPGQSCAILGPGTIGICTLAVAKYAGANPIIIIGMERDKYRLEMSKQFGADFIYTSTEASNIKKQVQGFMDQKVGVDIVFECSGSPHAQNTSIDLLRKGGTTVWIGVGMKSFTFESDKVVLHELNIKGSIMSAHGYGPAIKILESGVFPFSALVTNECSLKDLPEVLNNKRAFSPREIKTVVNPWI